MKIYKAADYGVRPYGFCQKELCELLNSLPKDEEEKTLLFEKGTYFINALKLEEKMLFITNTVGDKEFSKNEVPHLNRSPLFFSGLKNLTVDGMGARFVIHGKATHMVIDGCENITVKNLTVTSENPEMHELKVADKGKLFVDFEIDPESRYVKEKSGFYFTGHGYKRSFRDCLTTAWWIAHFPADRPDFCQRTLHPLRSCLRLTEKGKGKIRAYYPSTKKFIKGDRYYLYDVRRQYAGIFVQNSRNVTLEGIRQPFNYSLAFVAQNTENITLSELDFTPEENRVMCSVADFIQICMCRGRVRVLNSRFSGAGDDCMNVHGFHFKIIGKRDNTVTVRFMHPQSHGFNAFEKDDKIEFICPDTLLSRGGAKVISSRLINEYDLELELDSAENAREGEFIENTTACPDVDFIGNEVDRIITRGLLLTTRGKVLIENNHFTSTTMSGILLSDDADNWFESGPCHDLTVKGNTFDYCGENGILIKPENKTYGSAVHKNITVTGNTFRKCERPCFDIKDSGNVILENNFIGECPEKLVSINSEIIKDF